MLNKKLRAFIRVDGLGNLIPATLEFRKKKPLDGRWVEISPTICCPGDLDGYLLIQNITASANVTAVSFPGTSWTGTIANGEGIMFRIPLGYDEAISVTVDTPSGRTIDTAVLQGTGTITTGGSITLATNVYSTSATPQGQYSITLR